MSSCCTLSFLDKLSPRVPSRFPRIGPDLDVPPAFVARTPSDTAALPPPPPPRAPACELGKAMCVCASACDRTKDDKNIAGGREVLFNACG